MSIRPAGSEAMWSAASRENRVIVGMPKPFVTEALGSPGEIRAPRSGEIGSRGLGLREGWSDDAARLRQQCGRVDPKRLRRCGRACSRTADRGADATEARIRDALAVGKTCTAALQDAGTPDREEPLSAGTVDRRALRLPVRRGEPNAFAAFVCLNGRVTSVERYVPNTQ